MRGRDVALGIDPMILASIRILGNVAPPSAIAWLERLETAPQPDVRPGLRRLRHLRASRQAGADASSPADRLRRRDRGAAEDRARLVPPSDGEPGADATGAGRHDGPSATRHDRDRRHRTGTHRRPHSDRRPRSRRPRRAHHASRSSPSPTPRRRRLADRGHRLVRRPPGVFASSGYTTTILVQRERQVAGDRDRERGHDDRRARRHSSPTPRSRASSATPSSAETTPKWRGDIARAVGRAAPPSRTSVRATPGPSSPPSVATGRRPAPGSTSTLRAAVEADLGDADRPDDRARAPTSSSDVAPVEVGRQGRGSTRSRPLVEADRTRRSSPRPL